MNIEKAVDEIKKLNTAQRHIFFDTFRDKIPGVEFKKHLYQNLPAVDTKKMVICKDSSHDRMYLMELSYKEEEEL